MSARSFRRDQQRRIDAARRRNQLRARKAAAAAAAVGALALAAPATSSAADLFVGSNGDHSGTPPVDCNVNTNNDCTLRDAINTSNSTTEDDTITFESSVTGTINLTAANGPLTVNDQNYSLTITGPGESNLTVSGYDPVNVANTSVFYVQNTGGSTGFTMSGLTVSDGVGQTAGGLFAAGGGPYSGPYGRQPVNLDHVTFSNNTGSGTSGGGPTFFAGGAITNLGDDMTITNSTITQNTSTASPGPHPPAGGGGIDNLGQLSVDNSTISGNSANDAGGGIFQGTGYYRASLDVSNSTISGNSSNYAGGGVSDLNFQKYGGSHNSITNTTIDNNSAPYGGGFDGKYLGGRENWTISHTTLSNNQANYGGGVNVGFVGGSFQLLDSTVSGNKANIGGGIGAYDTSSKYQGATQVNNSTIASNHAYGYGGGITISTMYNGPSGPVTTHPLPLFSTIVGQNQADGSGPDDVDVEDSSREGFDLSFSLLQSFGSVPITETPAGSNLLGVSPQLGALGNNGGPTQTQLPSINSPVVDHGSAPGNLTTDQRGLPRTVDTSVANADDGTDIGAVELPTGPPEPSSLQVHGVKKKHKKHRRVIHTKHKHAKIHVTFSSTTPGVTFQCSVDGGAFTPCTSPFTARVNSAPGKGKLHEITIQIIDSHGNVIGTKVVRFRVIEV